MTDLIERAEAMAERLTASVALQGVGRGSYALHEPTPREQDAAALIRELIAQLKADAEFIDLPRGRETRKEVG